MTIGIHIRSGYKKDDLEYTKIIPNGKNLQDSIQKYLKDFPRSKCFQIFTHGPRSKKLNNIDISGLKKLSKDNSIYVHSTYFTSWKEDKFDHIIDQLVTSEMINANGWVIHLPKQPPEFVIPIVKKMLQFVKNTKILLEVRSIAPSGNLSYETPDKLINLIKMLEKFTSSKHVGLVIDTAHIYASKVDIREYKSAKDYLSQLVKYKEWFSLLHLNGNFYPNIRAGDKHVVPFHDHDQIWRGISFKKSGLRAFLEFYNDIIIELDHHCKEPREFLSFCIDFK